MKSINHNKSRHIIRANRLHSFVKSQFINILILDKFEKPIINTECQVTFSNGIQKNVKTDKNGWLIVPCSEIPDYVDIKLKGVDEDNERKVYLNMSSVEEDEKIKRYLFNLGFSVTKDLQQTVMNFKEYYDLGICNEIDETFKQKLKEVSERLIDEQSENVQITEPGEVTMDEDQGRT